jgi:hypothetical protein
VDAAGKPLAGIETYGLRFDRISVPGQGRCYIPGDSATVYAVAPDERRILWLKQRSSGLSRLLQFTPKPQETEQTIVLEPPAVVTGRVISPEGAPQSELKIECVFDPNSAARLPAVKTGADGRFREELPAGGPFQLYAHPFPYAFFVEKLTVAAAERVELGDITIDRDRKNGPLQPKIQRGPEKRTKPHVDVSRTSVDLAGQVRGRVLLPNGQPAIGATVTLIHSTASIRDYDQWKTLATLRADSRGEFQTTVEIPAAVELQRRGANTTTSTAAAKYTLRHPATSATSPARVRASKIPMSSPLITFPTTVPRLASLASSAASGINICAATEPSPTTTRTAISVPMFGEIAASTRPTAVIASTAGTRRRRDTMSPIGTSRPSPSA